MSDAPPDDRQQLELRLWEQMQTAAREWRKAIADHESIITRYGDMFGHPDGAHARHMAAAQERLALERYACAVKAYADLLIRGNNPGS